MNGKMRKSIHHAFEAMVAYNKKSKEVDLLDELTEDQRKELEESIKQADRGETIPHEQVRKKIRKWLTE